MSSPYTDIELKAGLRANDRGAFNYVFDEYYAALVFYTQRFGLQQLEAEDLVLDMFTRFWQHNKEFDSLNAVKAYLYTSTRNACYNFIRDTKRRAVREADLPAIPLSTNEEEADFEITRTEIIRVIHAEIQNLPLKSRSVFRLTYFEGLNTQQVADRLNISVSNVTSQRANAIKQLKTAILKKGISLSWASVISLFLTHPID